MAQYKNYPRWQRQPVPMINRNGPTWDRQIDEIWIASNSTEKTAVQIRNFSTPKFGEMRHLFIKVLNLKKYALQGAFAIRNSEDPTYEQKAWVLSTLGRWKKLALEVFPKTSELVDGANLYHIWELENEEKLPFDLNPIAQLPDTLSDELISKAYAVNYELKGRRTTNGNVGYLYLRSKDGKELKWRQKYDIKNEIIGEDLIAVEVISEKFRSLNYTCLLCLPIDYTLDFGLRL